jgi:hypothetical protein
MSDIIPPAAQWFILGVVAFWVAVLVGVGLLLGWLIFGA